MPCCVVCGNRTAGPQDQRRENVFRVVDILILAERNGALRDVARIILDAQLLRDAELVPVLRRLRNPAEESMSLFQ